MARKLAEHGELLEFAKGETIILEGEGDNDVFFILTGNADVTIKKSKVATRTAGDSVGEMAILNPTEPRSATVIATSNVIALKVAEPRFAQLADEHPHVWKSVASLTADRLRQRSQFISPPNENPILFIGCSTESLNIAREIELGLQHDELNVVVWANGVFTASDVVIDKLLQAANESDFALFIFSPDDQIVSRGVTSNAPRDNTIFELGLFMGRLERSRTFVLQNKNTSVKVPTDLLGVVDLKYVEKKGGNLAAAMAPVCTQLRKVIQENGTRTL